ncbi:hypothetical protein Tco_0570416 [Tanacetum coccineum]
MSMTSLLEDCIRSVWLTVSSTKFRCALQMSMLEDRSSYINVSESAQDTDIYILEMYKNNKYWWKKDPLVILRGLSWSKIGKFEKGDYGSLFFEWSNPILYMAPTSIKLLQPWFIHSVDYFRTSLVDGQHNLSITASPQVLQQVATDAIELERSLVGHVFEHEPQLQLQAELVVEYRVAIAAPVAHYSTHTNNDSDVALEHQSESVPMFTSEDLVAEHHVIITSVQLIENVGDGDPSFVVKELVVVKKRIFSIEKFIKSKNDDMSEDFVASTISNVFIGEVSCDKLAPNIYGDESSKNDDICEDSVANEFVQKELESGDGKLPESAILDVLNGEISCDKFTPNIYDGESLKNDDMSEDSVAKQFVQK